MYETLKRLHEQANALYEYLQLERDDIQTRQKALADKEYLYAELLEEIDLLED